MEFLKFQSPRGKEGYMKLKLVLIVLALSMCSYSSEQNELKIVSLSTTHTEIIDSLDAEDQLVGIDAFYKLDLPVERIDAFTVTADDIAALNPDIVFVAFDFNGIIEGLENKDITYALLPPAKNLNEVYEQINIVGDLIGKSAKATEVVRDMKIEINSILNNVNYENVSVYHEIGYSYGIYSVNGDSLIGEIYNQLGINNIAQNVEEIFPSLVYEDLEGYKMVDYQKFSAVLIEAIKEQQQIISTQEFELNMLKLELCQKDPSYSWC